MLKERNRPSQQVYDHYTNEDQEVWQILFNRQMSLLNEFACKEYLNALQAIDINAHQIPNFEQLNIKLHAASQWCIKVVEGHVSPDLFFEMLSNKIFPATCWLRTRAELDYIEEPDMFHDVFGHVPLLIREDYANYMQQFGKMAIKWAGYPDITNILSRVYWFTIEFGLMQSEGKRSIYGAGIMSSPGETKHSMSNVPEVLAFDILKVIQTDFRTDVIQDLYFTISSFEELSSSLEKLESILVKRTVLSNVLK